MEISTDIRNKFGLAETPEEEFAGFTEEQDMNRKNETYEIVSKIAFLIGVREEYFIDDRRFEKKWFDTLRQDKNARIIRNLSSLRTIIFCNYSRINQAIFYDLKGLYDIPVIPRSLIDELQEDGINIIHTNWKIQQYVEEINNCIQRSINNCKNLMPMWVNWDYIKNMFVIPKNRNTREDLKIIWAQYTNNRSTYPYGQYIHNNPVDKGNILYNDKKFMINLYEANKDKFEDFEKVTNASNLTKSSIHDFIMDSEGIVMVVDCENSDPFKVYAMLQNLSGEEQEKIKRIKLYDDIHTSSAWQLLNRFVKIDIQHNLIERVSSTKSLVDMALAVDAVREYYEGRNKSFILLSSDSDYWGLVHGMPECDFLVLVEKEKAGKTSLENMRRNNIVYAFIDDFCKGNIEELEFQALTIEMQKYLDEQAVTIDDMLMYALENTRISYTKEELGQFKKKYLKMIRAKVDEEEIKLIVQ